MATATITSSSLRLTARRGRQTLKPQADFRDCLPLHKLCDTPLCCLLQAPCAPSPSFTSATRHIVITAHRRHSPPRLDRCICVKGERCFRVRSNPRAEFPRARKRFYRASGSLRGGRSAYSEGKRGARAKRATDTMETTKFFRDNLSKSMKKFNFASDKRS